MLIQKESYTISTLCNADTESVEKCQEIFNRIRREIIEIDPECVHVHVVPRSCVKTVRYAGNRKIDVYRLTWDADGEKDFVEKFFHLWKERVDHNPFRSFFVRQNYSYDRLAELMSVRLEEEE